MSDHKQQDETYDMYDEFDCEVEEGTKTMEVKEEEENSETDCYVLESDDDQSAGNGEWIVLFLYFLLYSCNFFL